MHIEVRGFSGGVRDIFYIYRDRFQWSDHKRKGTGHI